jgi:putative transposase
MWQLNPTWGKPRIQAELAKLGITISDATVLKYRPKTARPPSQSWRTFLANHMADTCSMDFLTVPTATFGLLYVLVLLSHNRREIVHINITSSPNADWIAQQITEAFPYKTAPRCLLRDNDKKYGRAVKGKIKAMGIEDVTTAYRSPWQNPYCERVIGSIRRECLNHVIVMNEKHLRRVLNGYVAYYHGSRTHQSLDNDCPTPRPAEPPEMGNVIAFPKVGGLHHHYAREGAKVAA